jgi:phosphatidylserine decarboxylase
MIIARDGLREMTISLLVCAAIGGGWAFATRGIPIAMWAGLVVVFGLFAFTVLFFRDPPRAIPTGAGLLVSPADGKVTEVVTLPSYPGIDGPALKISIFLSVFDVHINRMPCAGRVTRITYRPGQFLDARHPECGTLNEANEVTLQPEGGIPGPLIVRQVAGLIARRIICHLHDGDRVERGQRFGLIKFGSRTDLIMPALDGVEALVRVNDVVRGGSSVLVKVAAPNRTESREASLSAV